MRSRRIATTDALSSTHGEVIARCNEDQGSYTITLLRANLELTSKAFPNDSDRSLAWVISNYRLCNKSGLDVHVELSPDYPRL